MSRGIALALLLSLAPARAWAQQVDLDRVAKEQLAADEAGRASQQRINELDDETQALLSEYRRALADTESYSIYAQQLEAQVAAQNEEMLAMERQLVEVETTSREVVPLMQRMLETLDQFVALDVPFLLDERRDRVTRLREMMRRADVTISEKYRRIIEAYQVELDYGRTVEAYEGRLGDGPGARTVALIRVGRVGLLYQTLDGRETGYWDANAKRFVVDDDYRESFKEATAVAKKIRAPEMLIVPLLAPKDARS